MGLNDKGTLKLLQQLRGIIRPRQNQDIELKEHNVNPSRRMAIPRSYKGRGTRGDELRTSTREEVSVRDERQTSRW